MTITRRTLAIISVAMLVVVLFIYIIISRFFMNSILSFEKQAMENSIIQAANAIAFDIMTLEKFATDWAVWSQPYEFVQDPGPDPSTSEFASEFLINNTFEGQELNVLLFVDNDGRLVLGQWYDLLNHTKITVPDESSALLYKDPLLLSTTRPYDSVMGLVNMPEGPMMVVSQPIYDSELQRPMMGHLIVGRYLGDEEWERLMQVIHLPASLETAEYNGSIGAIDIFRTEEIDDINEINAMNIDVQTAGQTAAGSVFIRDIHGDPAFLLTVHKERMIYNSGLNTAGLIAGSMGLTALVAFVAIFLLIKRHVLDRVIKLTEKISRVSSLEEIPDLVDQGDDEIALLTFHIQKMLNQLKDSHDEFQYVSSYDPLTGVHNRSYYERYMLAADGDAARARGVIVCDIDGLKLANDLVGHEYGDRLLSRLSEVLQEVCPPDAMIARTGGDEFIIILADNRESYLNELCSRIQSGLQQKSEGDESLVSLSVSLGFAGNEHASVSLKEMYRSADNLMHRQKLHRSQSGSSSLVSTLRSALGARDYLTEGHASRMRELSLKTAHRLQLAPQRVPDLLLFTEFHDVGKIGVQDSILFKPGPLDEIERAKMQRHCEIGHQIAVTNAELAPIADFILKHHEWWNGQGYPLGLKEEEIPLECRILAVVDAWDAMTNDRPYRRALSVNDALAELRRGAGSQFDPEVVARFVSIIEVEAASA